MPQTAKGKKQPAKATNHADVLDLAGAAKFLRLPTKTVERLVAEQGLPGRKIGRHWRFLRAAIERWLEPAKAHGGSIFEGFGAWANDPTYEDYRRILEENRRRDNEEVA